MGIWKKRANIDKNLIRWVNRNLFNVIWIWGDVFTSATQVGPRILI